MIAAIERPINQPVIEQTSELLQIYRLEQLHDSEVFILHNDLSTAYVLIGRSLDIYTVSKLLFRVEDIGDNKITYYGTVKPQISRIRHDTKVIKFGDIVKIGINIF